MFFGRLRSKMTVHLRLRFFSFADMSQNFPFFSKFRSKGERLFGWDTRNLFKVTQETHLFHMINYITGFFYDISPIDRMPFWGQWDLKASFRI